ncbi:hypothetical protein JOQ06_029743 [Pogonophryne albipinna]|uniref:Obscurin-like protein 1 n=1 Tax=Pogonophryne albipinna TaxID=1090488 RepID=A0AAD6AZF7_9TELE|nr:hypothetical protein JOQ06_029743 [Pogonophryne albipinna]
MDVFGGAPRFFAYPRPVVVKTGTDAVLKCQIGGDPRPAVIWERNNEKIEPQGRYRIFEDGNVYNLIISAVTIEDSGQYICKAKNSIGETYAAATLKVEGEAQELELREENKPRFLIKPLSTRAGRGEDAVFSCKLWGNPRPDVVWEKDGRKLNEIFESTHFSVGFQDGGWFQLKIFKTRAPDGGVYTCKAKNEFGEALAGAVLLVDAGPGHEDEGNRNSYTNGHWKAHQGKQRRQLPNRLKDDTMSTKVKMFAVTEGKHAKFRCFVTGKPKPEIIWRKDGRLILSGRRYLLYEDREGYFTLKVLYCKQKDNGVYVCAASNTAGQTLSAVHLSVKEPPVRFKQPLIDLEVWERDLAVLECEVPEDSVSITWYLEDRRLQPGAKYGMEEWGTKRRLTIRDIDVDDDGIYLCEMPDGGRSIAEVAVKGTILRKLPRKVDVLEGENAAFCVEVENEEMDIHWYKDALELRRSKTSSQLRVKEARHCPPSCPVSVQINTERANAALLSWVPAQDSRKNPPSGYVLDRQEVGTGSQEWLQCLTTDSATSVEILGDSVPCEADYRFRICSVNKYGKSNTVEFPRAVHLVPVARIQAPLQDALVPEGQDALFSIELSASVIGTWFLNGSQLPEDERYSLRRSRTHQSLRIRGVRDTDNGAEITFIAYSIRDSAALYIQAPLVKFSSMSEMDRNKFVEIGNPIVLYCELSDPAVPVHWYKNGVELQTMEGLHIQSEGTMRRIVIQSAEFSHSGVYCCDAIDDVIRFNVEVEAPPVRFSAVPDGEKNKTIEIGYPIVLSCELSDPSAQVHWYKDGSKLHPQTGVDILTEGLARKLIVHSAELFHSGLYCCKTKGDTISFSVDIKAPPVKFSAIPEEMRTRSIEAGCPIVLQCVVSDPEAHVCWYKDETQLISNSGLEIQSEGNTRTLVVQSAELSNSGVYRCTTKDDTMEFQVEIKAIPVTYSTIFDVERTKSLEAGKHLELECEVADSTVPVCWYKDVSPPTYLLDPDVEKTESAEVDGQIVQQFEISDPIAKACWFKDGTQIYPKRDADCESQKDSQTVPLQLHDLSAEQCHYGDEIGEIADASTQYTVDVKAPLLKFSALSEGDQKKTVMTGSPIALQCELSDPTGQVSWFKDGTKLLPQNGVDIQSEGNVRGLVVPSAERAHTGIYRCESKDDDIQFAVEVKELQETDKSKYVQEGSPIVLSCELSHDASAHVDWYKDGMKLLPQNNMELQSDGQTRTLLIHSAEHIHCGTYECSTSDDTITFKVDVEGRSPKIMPIPLSEKYKMITMGRQIVLQCEVSDPVAQVSDSGLYSCSLADDVVTFQVDVEETERSKSVEAGSPINLQCETSDPTSQTCWCEDGIKLSRKSGINIESEGNKRTLIKSASSSCSGGYSYKTDDESDFNDFDEEVKEPPVMIIHPKEDVHLDRHVPEEIILSCELSRANGVVSWYKDGQKLQESENIKLKIEGPYRRLKIISSGVEDSGEYVCDTADASIFFHLSITEPPVRIVSPSQSQMELCQQTSERMVLSCEISRPNAVVRWYRDGLEVEENENLILEVDGVYRRLIIPETTVQDSAEYVCDTADDSMTFFVNIAEAPVRFVRPRKMAGRVDKVVGETLVLDCEVSRSNAEVTWKKNGEEVEDSRNITILEDGVMRQLTVHSLTMEDAGQYVCDAKDDVMDFHVEVQELPVKIIGKTDTKTEKQFLVSDDIILVCELSRSNASVSWYKANQLVDDTERYCSEEQGVFRSLVVLNAGLEDSGEYTCDAVDDKMVFYITVKEPQVSIIGNSGHPEHHMLVEGDDLILECEVSRPNATVQWLWNGEMLKPDTRIQIDSHDVVRKLVLTGLQPSDSGEYICDAMDDKLTTIVEVQELPVKFENKKPASNITANENESVTLCATVSREITNVRWLKDGQLLNRDNIHISSEGNTYKLTINPLQLSDSGEYVCDINTDQMQFSLLVKGSILILRCEISKPKGDVQWLKDGHEISPSRRHTIRAQGRERSFTIQQLEEEDAGEYACESTDDRTSATVNVQTPRVVEFIAELRNITVREGEDAVFKCVVSPEDTRLVWRLNGKQVAPNERTVISSNGLCHMLCIHNCMVSDSGRVTADAEGTVSEAELQIQEQQVLFTKKMTPVVAEEYSEATLEVEVGLDSGEVQWMRQGVLIHPGAKNTLKHKGRKHSLTIHRLAISDRGSYSCETLHDRTQAQLTVKPRRITIKRGLTDIKTTERETASFEVELSHSNVPGTWMRNAIKLKPTNHYRMSAKGQVHSLTIYNLSVEDTGTFTFSVENLKTTARLVVKEPPVTIFRKLEDQKFPDGAVISIECELSKHNVDVKWMKNGVELKPGKELRIYSMGRKRFLQIMKCHVSDSGIYTCDAGDATTSCTVEVYERELLILKRLQDVDIQEDQNAVFVCEISVEDLQGEWYKNGERIQPTSTIKLRQEGTKHFLLMCNVKAEDSGEIKFVTRHVESVARLEVEELPVNIVKPLEDTTALEKTRVLLDCTVSNPRCSIRWYKGSNVILPSARFEICSEGCYRKLIMQQVALDDTGTYSVQVGEYTCSAKLTVEAQPQLLVRELQDVEVKTPGEACFECEVSVPVLKAPLWTLNGEPLLPSAQVLLEQMGTVHRLTLRHTSPNMGGEVEFTSGRAKSRAQLRVISK